MYPPRMHLEAERRLRKSDPILAKLITRVGPCTLRPKRSSPFEALVRSVTYQQLNGNAAETILKRFIALYDAPFPSPEDILQTTDAAMRAAGLSAAKTAAIKDIADKTVAGIVPTRRQIQRLTDAKVIERLTVIRGVGPWTVEMLLIFTLGRPDVLPVSDYGVRQGVARVYGFKELPRPKELLELGERWRPHRSVASWYFWRALEL